MEALGFEAVDFKEDHSKGDIMIIPRNNSNVILPPGKQSIWPQGGRFILAETFQ